MDNKVEITLITSKRHGLLPSLMKKTTALGLLYRRCLSVPLERGFDYKLTLVCSGVLDCEERYLIKKIEELEDVKEVINIYSTKSKRSSVMTQTIKKAGFKNIQSKIKERDIHYAFKAKDPITHDALQMIEDRLLEIFGPVTSVLLKSAANKAKNVGELLLLLSKELTEDQRDDFLSSVEGL